MDTVKLTEGLLPRRLTSGFSHAIRNSLNAVALTLMSAERIVSRAPELERRGDLLHQLAAARAEADAVRQTLMTFVELVGPLKLDLERLPLASLLAEVIAEEEVRSSASGTEPVDLSLEADPEIAVRGDRELIAESLRAVIRNAVEALPRGEGGAVRVRVDTQDSAFGRVRVEDTGGGLTETGLVRCFDAFFTMKADHQGLGLTRAQRTLEAHGGSIVLVSGAEGGAVATVLLPLADRD